MHYLALGDSISIDEYTGVQGGGAASQLARALSATRFQNLTRDGWTTKDVLDALPHIEGDPDVVTITIGGNDLLALAMDNEIVRSKDVWHWEALMIAHQISAICRCLHQQRNRPIILNTVYDPTDGDDRLLESTQLQLGVRQGLSRLNDNIRSLARATGTLLCDLEQLFQGHGYWSKDPWLTDVIEPNLAGATAIATHWQKLLT